MVVNRLLGESEAKILGVRQGRREFSLKMAARRRGGARKGEKIGENGMKSGEDCTKKRRKGEEITD